MSSTQLRQIDVSAIKFYKALAGTSVIIFGFLAFWLGITGDARPPYFNVAFTTSWVVACMGIVAIMEYGRRRPQRISATWGEAMLGAVFVFFLMFWIYGILPHLFLTFADSELNWRPDRRLVGPGLPSWWAEGQNLLSWALPFNLNYLVFRDVLAAGIYGAALVANVAVFSIWQRRDKLVTVSDETTSKFGRPLVRSEQNQSEQN